jgi:hypothetical protein
MLERHSTFVDTVSDQPTAEYDESWCVYLLPLFDGTAFKIGFSCRPLQRIYSFCHRYYERFDLTRSLLLRLNASSYAREIEATLKREFSEARVEAPSWILDAAGGHTEWFSSACYASAQERLRLFSDHYENSHCIEAREYIRSELEKAVFSFEHWAIQQAQIVQDDFAAVNLGYKPTANWESLRDWFDAFRFFDVQLFKDDPTAHKFVAMSARLDNNVGLQNQEP